MKRLMSLALGVILAAGMSVATYAESVVSVPEDVVSSSATVPTPRMGYEDGLRTFSKKGSSWTSSKYYCVSGDRFGGGVDDPVKMTGKVEFSTSTNGPWSTVATKTLNGTGMTIEVTKKGWYRFVLTNPNSYAVEVQCGVIVN